MRMISIGLCALRAVALLSVSAAARGCISGCQPPSAHRESACRGPQKPTAGLRHQSPPPPFRGRTVTTPEVGHTSSFAFKSATHHRLQNVPAAPSAPASHPPRSLEWRCFDRVAPARADRRWWPQTRVRPSSSPAAPARMPSFWPTATAATKDLRDRSPSPAGLPRPQADRHRHRHRQFQRPLRMLVDQVRQLVSALLASSALPSARPFRQVSWPSQTHSPKPETLQTSAPGIVASSAHPDATPARFPLCIRLHGIRVGGCKQAVPAGERAGHRRWRLHGFWSQEPPLKLTTRKPNPSANRTPQPAKSGQRRQNANTRHETYRAVEETHDARGTRHWNRRFCRNGSKASIPKTPPSGKISLLPSESPRGVDQLVELVED